MRMIAPVCRRAYLLPLFAAAVMLTFASSASAQSKTFRWDDELCTRTGTYDARKYTEPQLRNTLSLFLPQAIGAQVDLHVWKYEDIARLDVEGYERQYKERIKKLRELDIVKTPYWERLRQDRLKEMEQVYELTHTTTIAYTRPEVLRDYPRATACKARFAGPIIAGGEDLVKAWRSVNLASQKVNVSPRHLQERFDRENASPDRLRFALVETMNFGWWNCAVALIEHPKQVEGYEAEREFRKLFTRVREKCDEP